MKYMSNNNVVYSGKYHVVFRSKYRSRILVDCVDERLKAIIQQVGADTRCELIEMEVLPDHVPPPVEVDPQYGIRRFLKMAKGRSSWLLRLEYPALRSLLPTLRINSYFVSTWGGTPLAIVNQSIESQKNV